MALKKTIFNSMSEEEKKFSIKNNFQNQDKKKLPKILLLDDDPIFGHLMLRASIQFGADTTYCKSIDDLSAIHNFNFDVAVVDFDLGSVTGIEITEYLENFTTKIIPVILVSQKDRNHKYWPISMRKFIHKTQGPFVILNAAVENALNIQQFYE